MEALALGKEPPSFGVHLLPQLLAAAQHLGLRDLEVGAAAHDALRALSASVWRDGEVNHAELWDLEVLSS